ncbi:efflux RND transporter periplasmic adaptor subunit [Thiohalobacter sp. IOR34]|uniref:efflux RND transporter periplasmic adaptor subunit n=1 Tax=Thiohalobacter sp. IOR34 TaxID=3057176 RepID=UPI0025B149F0|nr:efflux RND transporter periplasmic adaptor subunit [Thiohalobacter sp. IOR34]WJW76377.1 efflux RND transporter periplasmic adaptor subunit [Thiohalobacter sp. IOR34]
MPYSILFTLLFALGTGTPALATEDHDAPSENGHAHEEAGHEEGALEMDAATRTAQGIVTAPARRLPLADVITAPAEVVINLYRSSQVTPRIAAQIMARHARLGDRVKRSQRLVTLSSVEMAEAQGQLLVADREWQRVRKLGRKVVSERRYIETQVTRQQAYARVLAYGMTEAQIKALLQQGDPSRATGAFDLLSPQEGTVISDDFMVGELAEPGEVLFEISDESLLWVEAKLNPEDATRVAIGAPARIKAGDGDWLEGRVVQRHHQLDETTRTQSIRIEVDNRSDRLHPGQFVEAAIQSGEAAPVVAVPSSAVVLFQGSPTVFKLEGDELHPQPVETGVTRAGYTEITAGLAEGEEIVVKGAFLIKSLLLKSQMGEGHAH